MRIWTNELLERLINSDIFKTELTDDEISDCATIKKYMQNPSASYVIFIDSLKSPKVLKELAYIILNLSHQDTKRCLREI